MVNYLIKDNLIISYCYEKVNSRYGEIFFHIPFSKQTDESNDP